MTEEADFDVKLTILDRSTLEPYSVCPAQARFRETGLIRSVGRAAIVGQEVHDALSKTTQAYIRERGLLRPQEIASELEMNLRETRPDVQPEAIKAFQYSVWSWSKFLADIHHTNILRYDGGTGDKSGQLAMDYESLGLRVTSEVDLCYATPAPEVIEEVDYKSGWKFWSEKAVAESFQFNLHALLLFHVYPAVQCVRVRIWQTRINGLTYAVEFKRERIKEYDTRIQMAIAEWHRNRSKLPEKAEAWPSREACSICEASALCPAADRDIAESPEDQLRQLIAVEAKADALKELLNKWVDATGEDVTCNGVAYGIGKPKANRKPTKSLYQLRQVANDEVARSIRCDE